MRRWHIAAAGLAVAGTAMAQPPQLPTREQLAADNRLFITLAATAQKWEVPAEPARIAGPVYFVGTQGLGVYLVTTSRGHILMNTGMPSSGPMIEASIRKLGFDPQDIKLMVTCHAHADHAGAMAYLKAKTGAKVAVLDAEREALETGGKSDFFYGHDWQVMGFPAVKADIVFRDGDAIALGEVKLTALRSTGHTRGATTYVANIVDNGQAYTVVWPDGAGFNPGYRLAKDPSYPGLADDYRRTLHRLEMLRPDIWLASHTDRFDLDGKRARSATEGAKAWVDPEGYRRFIAKQRRAFEDEIDAEMGVVPPQS